MNNESEWVYDHTEDDDEEREVVDPFQISYFPADFTLGGYFDKHREKQLVIPQFQRNYVWDVVKASRLIESFLLGLPVPGVFLYKERATNKLQVVDGQQRITSSIRFFECRFGDSVFRLKGVQPQWEGKTFEDLTDAERFQLKDSVLRATVVQQLDPNDDSSVYLVFERLNTGGVNLNPMEVRKCVYFGAYFDTITRLNENVHWRQILGQSNPDKRLRDAELLLRVLAFGYRGDRYSKPMKGFLNAHMAASRKLTEGELEKRIAHAESQFSDVAKFVVEKLGETPFHLRGRLNYALTDVVMSTVFSRGSSAVVDNFSEVFEELLQSEEFLDSVSVSTSDERQVALRRSLAESAFFGS